MSDSLTFTLSGTSSILDAQYFPPIELSPHRQYVLGLVELLTFNSIPNIDKNNNKFYIGDHIIELPIGSYKTLISIFARNWSTQILPSICNLTIIHFAV